MKHLAFILIVAVSCMIASCGNSAKSEKADANEAVQLTKEEAQAKISDATSGKLTVIDFNATWCGPCRAFAPIFEEAQATFADSFEFKSIDIDNNQELAQKYNVEAIPCIVVLDAAGNEVARNVGFMEKEEFTGFLNEAQNKK